MLSKCMPKCFVRTNNKSALVSLLNFNERNASSTKQTSASAPAPLAKHHNTLINKIGKKSNDIFVREGNLTYKPEYKKELK